MLATSQRIATVLGTGILIVAVRSRSPDTAATLARVIDGAQVAIIAKSVNGRILTARRGVAAIRGAHFLVVADLEAGDDAGTACAMVPQGARVAVAALRVVRCEEAPLFRVAGIVSARIAVVTSQGGASLARTQTAVVARGAEVPVIAWGLVQQMYAADRGFAVVERTDIVIAAVGRALSLAPPFQALVLFSAWVTVVAFALHGCVGASPLRAAVRRAWVAVITVEDRA